MIDTRKEFGEQLKKMVSERQALDKIGDWAHSVHMDWPGCEDIKFLKFLIALGTLELGPEFAIPYEELDKIADDIIAGKDVELK